MANTKDVSHFETLVARVDAMIQSINDREKILSTMEGRVDDHQEKMQRLLEDKVAGLETKVNQAVSDQLKTTTDYTKELYSRFERMVWLGLLVLGAVSAFIGIQTFSIIPERVKTDVKDAVGRQEAVIKESLTEIATRGTKSSQLLEESDKKLKTEVDRIVVASQNSANARVEAIASNYEKRFNDLSIDSYIQILQRTSSEADLIALLVQAFPKTEAERQSRIAAILSSRQIPPDLIPAFRANIEAWSPGTLGGRSTRYQMLITLKSTRAKPDIQNEMKEAVARGDDDTVLELIRSILRVFNVDGAASGSGVPGSIRPPSRPNIDSEQIISDYLQTFEMALKSPTAGRVVPLLLDIALYSNSRNPTLYSYLARGLSGSPLDARALASLLLAIGRFPEERDLYEAVVSLADSNFDRMNSLPRSVLRESFNVPSELISYTRRNSSWLRNDTRLLTKTIDLLIRYGYGTDANEDGISRQLLESYLVSGNLFQRGARLAITDDGNRGKIRSIQTNDDDWTQIEIKQSQITLEAGTLIRIVKVSVDGSDTSDAEIGVEIVAEVGGKTETLRFWGKERFLIQSKPGNHIMQVGQRKVRFGIEIIRQEIALQIGLAT